MRSIKAAWVGKMRTLEDIISECGNIENKREDVYLKAVANIHGLNGLCITYESGLIAKERLMVDLEKLKQSQEMKFNDINNFSADKISKWIITFVGLNNEYSSSIL